MPNIKLVLCDIDGTIMPYGQKMVSERMRAAFHAALDAGIRVGVATGRGFSWMPGFFDNDAACIATCVATNGAEIFLDGEKIQEAHLPVEPLREAAEILRGIPGTGMLLFDGAKPLLAVGKREDLAVSMPAYASSCEDVDGVGDEEPSKGNAFVNGGRKEAQELCALLNERVADLDFDVPQPGFLNIMAAGVNKASGIDRLCAAMGITLEQVVVFGDGGNDVSMLVHVPNSVAVSNAAPEATEAARWHVGACEDDAVADAIFALAAGEWPFIS